MVGFAIGLSISAMIFPPQDYKNTYPHFLFIYLEFYYYIAVSNPLEADFGVRCEVELFLFLKWFAACIFTSRFLNLGALGQISLCCGGHPVHCGMFSSPDLCPLDASSTTPFQL